MHEIAFVNIGCGGCHATGRVDNSWDSFILHDEISLSRQSLDQKETRIRVRRFKRDWRNGNTTRKIVSSQQGVLSTKVLDAQLADSSI